mmetsp:Transcript_9121/g.22665  ORF Transcript_9121/g.22665 Transcript_9121/m.22665 type:complete len:295 (-) Transcript_9121:152-1036(-)
MKATGTDKLGVIRLLCGALLAPGVTQPLCAASAQCLNLLCRETEHRGALVSSGAVRALLAASSALDDERARDSARQALAQLAITTNPNLLAYDQASNMVKPLCELIQHNHELLQFEAALALTNLSSSSASYGDELRVSIYRSEGWNRFRDLLFSDNTMLQRAGLEGMCNMCQCELVLERFAEGKGGNDLKIMLAFVGVDDVQTCLASSGALAMLSGVAEIVPHITKQENFLNILAVLAHDDAGVQHRAAVCAVNCARYSKDDAETLRKVDVALRRATLTGQAYEVAREHFSGAG